MQSLCSENVDYTGVPWNEVENIIFYFTDKSDKLHCLSLNDIKNNYDTRNTYIRMNDFTRRKLFLLPQINVLVDDSFIHGILRLSNVFYMYPRYRALPEEKNEDVLVYVAIPISKKLFSDKGIQRTQNYMKHLIDHTIIPINEVNDIKQFLFPTEEENEEEENEEKAVVYQSRDEMFRIMSPEDLITLLSNPQTNPSIGGNGPIRIAYHWGRLDLVKILLEDPRTNPFLNNSYEILFKAVCDRNIEVTRMLLQHPKFEPSESNNKALKTVALIINQMFIPPELQELETIINFHLIERNIH